MAKIRHRIPDPKYIAVEYPELGSWNPTLNDGGPENNQLFAVKNLRMQVPGQYQIRSGYKRFTKPASRSAVIFSKGEYELFGQAFDLTFYYDLGAVSVILFNKTSQTIQLTLDILTGLSAAPEMVTGIQNSTYYLVSIYDKGEFAFYPKWDDIGNVSKVTSALAADWTIMPIGKELAFTPQVAPSFAPDTTGDLLIRQNHHTVDPFNAVGDDITFDYQPGLPEAPVLRLDVKAKYWSVDNPIWAAAPGATDSPLRVPPGSAMTGGLRTKLWEWNKIDPSGRANNPSINSINHLQKNSWNYRLVFIQETIDAEGNKITHRSQASVDFSVPNNMYGTAFLGYDGTSPATLGDFVAAIAANTYGPFWAFDGRPLTFKLPVYDDGIVYPGGNFGMGFPSQQDLRDLAIAFRTYFHEEKSGDTGGQATGDPYYGAAGWFSWAAQRDIQYHQGPPLIIPVSAYDLKKAPMAVFNWTDFSELAPPAAPGTPNPAFPSNVIKIEVYRTAFNGVGINESEATFTTSSGTQTSGNPLFQPNLYGFVGSIEPDGTFTDSVEDTLIDFGKTPESYDGFLIGQFSGKVMREYNDKVAILNTISDYWVFAPSAVQQAIAVELNDVFSYPNRTASATINSQFVFYYQYEDDKGNVSDLQEISVTTTDTGSSTTHIFFKIPLGYAPDITKLNIIQKDTGSGRFDLVAKVDVYEDAYEYEFKPNSLYTGTGYLATSKNVKVSKEPGGIIYSLGNDIWSYPFDNQEILSKIYPITAAEVIMGRLWVWTERGLYYTLLAINQNGNTLGEEETVHGGNLGFHTLSKANKVVFFLSTHGLCFAQSSGVDEFPGYLQAEVLPYLNEQILNVPALTNAKRATVKWLGQRDEVWLHFPSSVDLGGTLPERTFIYRLGSGNISNADTWSGSVRGVVNYEFELINSLDPSLNPIDAPVILYSHTDGTLYSSYLDADAPHGNASPEIVIMNNDTDDTWMGQTILEKRLTLGAPTKKKKLRGISFRAEGQNKMWLATGRPYPTSPAIPANTPDYLGQLYPTVRKFLLKNAGGSAGQPQLYKFRINGPSIETTAYIPAIRLVTEPDGENNSVIYYSLNSYLVVDDHV